MHGSLYEWVWDEFEPYSSEAQIDPVSSDTLSTRDEKVYHTIRGGAYSSAVENIRSAYRAGAKPDFGGAAIRLARNAK
jgi:formylglycine-generating enzyme required for sulfatase activity